MAQDAPIHDPTVDQTSVGDTNAREQEPASVYELVVALTEPVIELAWQKLGLRPDLRTGTIAADLPEAKVAIDLAAYLANVVEPKLDEEDRRQLSNVVRDLRLNYVSRAEGRP